jgi:hypothetical protein
MAVTHRSLSIAVESGGFGSLDVSTGLPSSSGLTYISIPCERDPIVIAGEPVVSERNDARDVMVRILYLQNQTRFTQVEAE